MGRRLSWRHDLDRDVPRSGSGVAGKVGGACAATVAVLALSGCGDTGPGRAARLGLVDPASDRAAHMGSMWIGAWVAALVIGVFVWGLIGYAAFKFRRKDGDPVIPRQSRYHLPL
ncbi:MAG: cytochrome c oxidase subunit II, partial [Cutibacterium avidum]|nr:cytochrome c oxidase subunit II [Cutibacterium avidum]